MAHEHAGAGAVGDPPAERHVSSSGAATWDRGMLPLPLSCPMAHAATWIVSHTMPSVRDALVDNLRAVFPHETDAQLRRRAYRTCHTYTDDWMDFMRSISWSREKVLERFSFERADLLRDALALGRGAILVTGHFGNWEAGAVLMKALQVPLTVVAMPEPDPNVNRIRHRVRSRARCRHHRSPPVARYGAPDPATPCRRPGCGDVDGPARRARSRAGDDVRTTNALHGRAGAARVPDRRAAGADLPGARRAWPVPRAAAGAHLRRSHWRPRRAGPARHPARGHAARSRDRRPPGVLVSVLSVLGRDRNGTRESGLGTRTCLEWQGTPGSSAHLHSRLPTPHSRLPKGIRGRWTRSRTCCSRGWWPRCARRARCRGAWWRQRCWAGWRPTSTPR